ncbi:MAG TPA: hypothetical protein VNO30_40150 [Kofleriaceae bacterium]|nr:hypothetical protein [Kofleriaceae bacterium]
MRVPALALPLLAACSEVPPLCITDAFEAGAVDARRWKLGAPAQVATQDGRLELALPVATPINVFVSSFLAIDLSGRAAEVDVARYLRASDPTQSLLAVLVDNDNVLLIKASAGALYFQLRMGGVDEPASPSIAADPAIDGWRIAHDASTEQVRFETRRAGAWTTQRALAKPFSLLAVKVQLEADALAPGASAPDVAAFSDLRVTGEPACTSGAEYDEHRGPYGPP